MPNKKTTAQRQPYVDAMKGFGILCVVIGHFIEYHRGTAPGINALFTCIYLFHMAIFCTASGLVAKFSLRKLVTQQLWLYLISQAGITASSGLPYCWICCCTLMPGTPSRCSSS